jgi:hypothetical protein
MSPVEAACHTVAVGVPISVFFFFAIVFVAWLINRATSA